MNLEQANKLSGDLQGLMVDFLNKIKLEESESLTIIADYIMIVLESSVMTIENILEDLFKQPEAEAERAAYACMRDFAKEYEKRLNK